MRHLRNEVDWVDVWITAGGGCIAAFLLFLFLALPAHGLSTVDPTIPVASSSLSSAPVRTNFENAQLDLDDLFTRFPGTTAVSSIPAWSTTNGFFKDPAIGFLGTSSGGVPFLQVLGATLISGYTNTSSVFPVLTLDPGSSGTADILQIRNGGTPLWKWDKSGNLTTDLAGSNKFNVTTTGALNWEGSGVSNDVLALNCTGLVLGDCLDIDEDGTQRLKLEAGGAFSLVATSVTPIRVTQAGTGVVSQFVTTTTGDDPTESKVQGRVATTDATQTTILTIAVPTNKVLQAEVNIIGRVTGGAGGNADTGVSYKVIESVKNVSGTVTRLEGTAATEIEASESAALSAYAVTIDISTTNIIVTVTGAATDNVTWHAFATYVSVGS